MSEQSKSAEPESRESERRRTILRAAIDVFARKGYHGCRVADVAREAGVAYGLVYHYFKNKDELLRTVFETGWGGFVARLRAVAESEAPIDEKVRRFADVAFDAYRVDPRAVKVLILEIARSPVGDRMGRNDAFAEVIRMGTEMFHKAQEAGELRAELDPRLTAALFFGGIEMGLTAFVAGFLDWREASALDRARNQITESFLSGVLTPAASEATWKPEKTSSATKSKAAKHS